ncbi:unnamed protein product [Chondrus crispus]|uniref:Uncharacterized protein n=1 Tax=Chondrus crispus TaxID=2769 RepID=R7Q9A5_CHOCR|nr:unnamed protein product [Chondrus crispus]CDF34045.1 unnamed protein product [Chondrus crispus]|eukprot:XP_005713864.1 unnamed protein product [Chondrus crispus]
MGGTRNGGSKQSGRVVQLCGMRVRVGESELWQRWGPIYIIHMSLPPRKQIKLAYLPPPSASFPAAFPATAAQSELA